MARPGAGPLRRPGTVRRWGALSAAPGYDSADLMIAATALEHGFAVVTRSVSDFEPTGVAVLDPFGRRPTPNI
jgi:predicted nucleic acid-binding protein